MYMNGEYLETLQDLKRCFCIDELVYSYYSGELELFLDKIGAHEKAERIRKIPVSNALLLIRLYEIFECNLEDSEEKIRSDAASVTCSTILATFSISSGCSPFMADRMRWKASDSSAAVSESTSSSLCSGIFKPPAIL